MTSGHSGAFAFHGGPRREAVVELGAATRLFSLERQKKSRGIGDGLYGPGPSVPRQVTARRQPDGTVATPPGPVVRAPRMLGARWRQESNPTAELKFTSTNAGDRPELAKLG